MFPLGPCYATTRTSCATGESSFLVGSRIRRATTAQDRHIFLGIFKGAVHTGGHGILVKGSPRNREQSTKIVALYHFIGSYLKFSAM